MKVLHIIESLGFGGAEFALLNLLPALKCRGVESYVCALNGEGELQTRLERQDIKVLMLSGMTFIKKRIFVNKLCTEEGIDIVHSHLTRSLILSGFLSGSFKRVNSYHNLGYSAQPTLSFKARIKKNIASFIARNKIDLHIGVSQAVVKHYKNHYRLKVIDVIPNPITVPNLKYDCNGTIVVPGRLVTEKGHIDLLDVIKNLKGLGFDCSWVFAGGGYLHSSISDKITQLQLEKTVTITGALPHQQFLMVVAQSHMVVLPSIFEGFGMAAAEAMMLGRAVVVSDAGGLAEIVSNNETGLVFSKGNKEHMLEQLLLILGDDSLRNNLANAGKESVIKRFSVDNIALLWEKQYQGLVS